MYKRTLHHYLNVRLLHFSQKVPIHLQFHTLTLWSTLAVIMVFYFIAMVVTKWEWIFKSLRVQRAVCKSHTLMLLSSLTESKNFPYGWKHKSVTQLSCPYSEAIHLLVFTSQSLTVLSRLPDAKKSLSLAAGVWNSVADSFDSSSWGFFCASRFI